MIRPVSGRNPLRRVLGRDAALEGGTRAAAMPSWRDAELGQRLRRAAIRICAWTRSMPVTSSVTVCSTWMRGFISMKT